MAGGLKKGFLLAHRRNTERRAEAGNSPPGRSEPRPNAMRNEPPVPPQGLLEPAPPAVPRSGGDGNVPVELGSFAAGVALPVPSSGSPGMLPSSTHELNLEFKFTLPPELLERLSEGATARIEIDCQPQPDLDVGLGICACKNAPSEARAEVRAWVGSTLQRLQIGPDAPWVYTDMDAGRLATTARHLQDAMAQGVRKVVLCITDRHYPGEMTGHYRWDKAGAKWCVTAIAEKQAHAGTDEDLLFCDKYGEVFLKRFLDNLAERAKFGDLELTLHIYRHVSSLVQDIRAGAVPQSHMITGIDLEKPLPVPKEFANRILFMKTENEACMASEAGPKEPQSKTLCWAGLSSASPLTAVHKVVYMDDPYLRLAKLCAVHEPKTPVCLLSRAEVITDDAAFHASREICEKLWRPLCQRIGL